MTDETILVLKGLLKNELSDIRDGIHQLDSNIEKLNKRLDKIESKLSVNSYLLEKINVDINSVRDVQDAHMKQSEKYYEESMKHEYRQV